MRRPSLDTRLAVRLATAPFRKVRRALAMSTEGVSTGIPAAAISASGAFTSIRTRSTS